VRTGAPRAGVRRPARVPAGWAPRPAPQASYPTTLPAVRTDSLKKQSRISKYFPNMHFTQPYCHGKLPKSLLVVSGVQIYCRHLKSDDELQHMYSI
jgi:hypothetical protein